MADRIIIRDAPDIAVPPIPAEPRARVVYTMRAKPPPKKRWPLWGKLLLTVLFMMTAIAAPQDPQLDLITWLGLFAFMGYCVYVWGSR